MFSYSAEVVVNHKFCYDDAPFTVDLRNYMTVHKPRLRHNHLYVHVRQLLNSFYVRESSISED